MCWFQAADIIKAAQASTSVAGTEVQLTSSAAGTSSASGTTEIALPSAFSSSGSSGAPLFATTTTFVTVVYTQTVYAA